MKPQTLPQLARRFIQTERRLARANEYREILTGRILAALAGQPEQTRAGEYIITKSETGFIVQQCPPIDSRQLCFFNEHQHAA